jgi:hypothetical protein
VAERTCGPQRRAAAPDEVVPQPPDRTDPSAIF